MKVVDLCCKPSKFSWDKRMKKVFSFLLILLFSEAALAVNCGLVYDEFDNLMNKEFLINPASYVKTMSGRLSRSDYNSKQKGKFLLNQKRQGHGIAVVHTNKNSRGKFLFTWSHPNQSSPPILVIKEVVLYGRVKDGYKPVVRRNLNIKSSFTLDLDTGKMGGKGADIWFHNVDGKRMYIEARNGATLHFPMQSLCKSKVVMTTLPSLEFKPKPLVKPISKPLTVASKPELTLVEPNSNLTHQGSCTTNSGTEIKRELLANGNVQILYSDGSKRELIENGMIITCPDDSQITMRLLKSTAAPAAIAVGSPDLNESQWLEGHRENLRLIIETIVDDKEVVEEALESADTSDDLYESISTRSSIIQNLVGNQ